MSSWDCVWARKDAVTTQHVQGLTPHSLLTLITSPSPEKIRADADTLTPGRQFVQKWEQNENA